jgi:hypothetical protein
VVPRLDRYRVAEIQLAGRAVRELARLLSTQIRRARVAGARPRDATARAIRGSEVPFELNLATPAGAARMTGRLDLLVGNEVDDRIEVWELKTFVDTTGAAEEQATLYALALARLGLVAPGTLRPAVLHVHGGSVLLRAVAPPGDQALAMLAERVARMDTWARDPRGAPLTSNTSACLACPVRHACWAENGPTLALDAAPAPAPARGPAPPAAPAAPAAPAVPAVPAPPAAPAPAPSAPAASAPAPTVDILLGHDERGRDVRWLPGSPERPLENFGFLVTGDSGSGKTQTLRALIDECRRAGVVVVALDFKNDFSTPEFLAAASLTGHDVRDHGLPYNPLTLLPQQGRVRPMEHIYKVEAILTRVLGLGVQQGAALNRAMRAAYTKLGIGLDAFAIDAPVPGPSFADVLDEIDGPPTLAPRLQPLVDLRLLRGDREVVGDLGGLLSSGGVLDLHNLPLGHLSDALVELTLLGIHSYLLDRDQPRRLTRLLVLDEAHRVAASPELALLLREGRAFGLGFGIGTQFPGDLDDEVQGSLATKLFLRNDQDTHRSSVARHLCGAASGPQANDLKKRIQRLDKHEGFLVNAQHRPYRFVKVVPHHARARG